MSDDITFCGNECNNKKCFRHPSNIAEPNISHSFAYLKDTDMCPMKKQEIRLIDAEALKKEIFEHCRSEKECLNHFWFDENLISLVDNAPTVKDRSFEIAQKSIELGRKVGQLEGKLERPQGDLISREALKKEISKEWFVEPNATIFNYVFNIIDNAPTVELTEEQAIDKLHETGWLIRHDKEMTERPHGEWITSKIDGEKYNCSECGSSCWYYDYRGNVSKSNFCPNCGADMRGEEDANT